MAAEHGVELARKIELKQEGLRRELRAEELGDLRQQLGDLALERATIQAQLDSPELAHIDLDSLEIDRLKDELQQKERRLKQLEKAERFVKRHNGNHDGRFLTAFYPGGVMTCSFDYQKAIRAKSDELEIPVSIHAGEWVIEFQNMLRMYASLYSCVSP